MSPQTPPGEPGQSRRLRGGGGRRGGGADNAALSKPPPQSLGARTGCQRQRARGFGGSGGPHQHPPTPQPPPSPSAERRGLLRASRIPAASWGATSSSGLSPAPGRSWGGFGSEQRVPQKGGGGQRGAEAAAAQPCHELAGSQRRRRAGISLAPRLHRNSNSPAEFFLSLLTPALPPPKKKRKLPPFFFLGTVWARCGGGWKSGGLRPRCRARVWGERRGLSRSCPRRDGRRKTLGAGGRQGRGVHPPPRRWTTRDGAGGLPGTAGRWGQGMGDIEPRMRGFSGLELHLK